MVRLGVSFEILGLAFEIAQRKISLENYLYIKTYSPFYRRAVLQALLSEVIIIR